MNWKPAVLKEYGVYEVPNRWLKIHYFDALNTLFRVENALRVFVYIVLKNQHLDKWLELCISTEEEKQTTLSAVAKKRMSQGKPFAYLGFSVTCPVMHLTTGELIRLMTSDEYWDLFAQYFRGRKDIMRTKLDEIGVIRNALAHFRPLKPDDVDVVKQNAKHTMLDIEECLNEITRCYNVVPTNTTDSWFTRLSTINNNVCRCRFYQSNNEKWVRVELTYIAPIIHQQAHGQTYRSYWALRLHSQQILRRFGDLAKHVIFLSESQPAPRMETERLPDFSKAVSMVFSRETLSANEQTLASIFSELILAIEQETGLIQQDNLARGELISLGQASASYQRTSESSGWWRFDTSSLLSPVKDGDPPEYWGQIAPFPNDFVAGTTSYPWIPGDVSDFEF